MSAVWFDHGLSSVADAIAMADEERLPGLRIIASHRDRHAAALRLADEAFVEPVLDTASAASVATSLAWCLDVCARRGVDVFAVQSRQRVLAPHAAAFASIGTRLLLVAPAEVLDTLDDKTRFHAAAVSAGLPMPWSVEVRDVAAFDRACATLAARGLDACVKPPRGIFGAGYWRLDDTRSAFDALMRPDDRRMPAAVLRDALDGRARASAHGPAPDPAPDPAQGPPQDPVSDPRPRLLVLEYLRGPEWSVDCLCEEGRTHAVVARLKCGRVQRLAVDGPAIELARRTVAAFGLSGLLNVQLRSADDDAEGDLRVLEVNARMSGGCLYTRASGVNLPWWHLALAVGARAASAIPAPVGGMLVAAMTGAVDVGAEPIPDDAPPLRPSAA